jgi:hypothetical protein
MKVGFRLSIFVSAGLLVALLAARTMAADPLGSCTLPGPPSCAHAKCGDGAAQCRVAISPSTDGKHAVATALDKNGNPIVNDLGEICVDKRKKILFAMSVKVQEPAVFDVAFGKANPFSKYQKKDVFLVGTANATGVPLPSTQATLNQTGCFEFQIDYCAQGKACLPSDPRIIIGDN